MTDCCELHTFNNFFFAKLKSFLTHLTRGDVIAYCVMIPNKKIRRHTFFSEEKKLVFIMPVQVGEVFTLIPIRRKSCRIFWKICYIVFEWLPYKNAVRQKCLVPYSCRQTRNVPKSQYNLAILYRYAFSGNDIDIQEIILYQYYRFKILFYWFLFGIILTHR